VSPPDPWKLPVIMVLGIFVGLGMHVLYIANAASYLSDDPEACVNCHVMNPQFATWQRGSHGRVATCNDCHVPHDNIAHTYYFKAQDGLRHSTMFTFRLGAAGDSNKGCRKRSGPTELHPMSRRPDPPGGPAFTAPFR
jgi:cytochrome c nitrite reductase small subunit